jgi:hypothetical protein
MKSHYTWYRTYQAVIAFSVEEPLLMQIKIFSRNDGNGLFIVK